MPLFGILCLSNLPTQKQYHYAQTKCMYIAMINPTIRLCVYTAKIDHPVGITFNHLVVLIRTLTNIASFFIIAIFLCFTHTLIWRLWLTYFELMRSVSLLKMSWHQSIAPKEDDSENWYLSKQAKATWGNPLHLKKVVLSAMFCHVFIYAIVFFIFGSMTLILRLLLIFVPWIGIYILYRRIPVIHDEIGIAAGSHLDMKKNTFCVH